MVAKRFYNAGAWLFELSIRAVSGDVSNDVKGVNSSDANSSCLLPIKLKFK